MPFVKIDKQILNSSLWIDRDQRDVFVTALIMAEPFEAEEEMPQIEVGTLNYTGFVAPAGFYGFVAAAGPGIARMAISNDTTDIDRGMTALRKLGEPDPDSRNQKHEGRRLIRVDHGYLILNYADFFLKDYNNAARCKRWREKVKAQKLINDMHVVGDDTHVATPSRDRSRDRDKSNEDRVSAASPLEPIAAAFGYCNTFGIVGHWDRNAIAEAVKLEVERVGVTPEQAVDAMVAARSEYEAHKAESGSYCVDAVSFITKGTWRNKTLWNKAKEKAQPKKRENLSAEHKRKMDALLQEAESQKPSD